MDKIFDPPVNEVWNFDNVYALATLARAQQFPSPAYVAAVTRTLGCATYTRNMLVWPPPWSVGYHPDGVLVCFDGLKNFAQFAELYSSTALCRFADCPGLVMHYLRRAWEAIGTSVLAQISAAPNSSRIVVAGISAGGALATVAACKINAALGSGRVKYVVTFGSPRPGERGFAEGYPLPLLAVENKGDVVPRFPVYDTVYNAVTGFGVVNRYPVMPGQVCELDEAGAPSDSRSFELRSTEPTVIVQAVLTWGFDSFGYEHWAQVYTDRLLPNVRRVGYDSREETLRRLNLGMNSRTLPIDFTTPMTPTDQTPIATPPAPTVTALQSIPSNPGGSGDPPPTYSAAMVGATQRVTARAFFTSSTDDTKAGPYRGKDLRLISHTVDAMTRVAWRESMFGRQKESRLKRPVKGRRLVTALRIQLERIAARDVKNATVINTRSLSTRRFIIDPQNADLTADFAAMRARVDDYLANWPVQTTFHLDDSTRHAFDHLLSHLTNTLYFHERAIPVG